MKSLVAAVSFIDSDKSLRKSFERLIVVNPDLKGTPFGDLEDVIKEYNGRFVELGWKLKKIIFTDSKRHEKCENTLVIAKAE